MIEKVNMSTTPWGNTEKTKQFIRLPRGLIIKLHDSRRCGKGTAYTSCLALATIIAKLLPLTGDADNQIISCKELRRQWRAYGYSRTTMISLLKNLTRSPLADYIVADKAHISVTQQWLSAVVCYYDDNATGLNYIRIPISIIPLIRTHATAVDAVLYGFAKNKPPHTALAAKHRNHTKRDTLRAMIDVVSRVLRAQHTDNTQPTRGANIIVTPCIIAAPCTDEQTVRGESRHAKLVNVQSPAK